MIYYKNNGENYHGNISINAVKSDLTGSMQNKAASKEAFWSDEYRPYIENIEFIIDGNFECKELCFDISEGINKVYAKLIKKEETYDLQIISDMQIYLPDDSSKLFSNFPKLKNINFKNTNTEYVIDMSYMFAENTNIENLDLSSFNVKKVETMEGMFKNCENLKTIDLSSFTFNETLKYNLIFKNINPNSIIYVKSSIEQAWIFGLNIYIRPGTWTIKNADDTEISDYSTIRLSNASKFKFVFTSSVCYIKNIGTDYDFIIHFFDHEPNANEFDIASE